MNIKAVALKARVSTATVSRTINGSAIVTPKTAERVRRAIEALNFYPDVNARALGSGRSSLYGLIISDITNPFFPELVRAFEEVAVEHKQEVLIANTNYDKARMETCVIRMLQRKVDGVAIMTSEMDDRLVEVFTRRHIPLVLMDNGSPGPGVSSVRFDYRTGVVAAMEHLISLKHSKIGFISGPLTLDSAQVRFNAFTETMAQHDLTSTKSMITEGNHRVDGGYRAMKRILSGNILPTAIMCSNDLTAIGAMSAIFEHGLRVPEDISVVGYDDIQLAAHTHPSLTTLRLPRTELANCAFHSLFGKRSADRKTLPMGEAHLFQPELIVRKSTGQRNT
ncbi:MAG: LacI family DNA-binding transcriptional regulator [Granulicella sp.]